MMRIRVDAISDQGCVRANNEDHILVRSEIFTNNTLKFETTTSECRLFAVADGMGGHKAGEVASEMVLRALQKWGETLDADVSYEMFVTEMNTWLEKIHQDIVEMGNINSSMQGMGTTLSGLFFGNNGLFVFNAGDSRTYVFKDGKLKKLTIDHTLSSSAGFPEVKSHLLVNCIGAIKKSFIEVKNVGNYIARGGAFLICSDGLTDMLNEDEITTFLSPPRMEEMVEAAKEKGGRDNISVVCIHLMI